MIGRFTYQVAVTIFGTEEIHAIQATSHADAIVNALWLFPKATKVRVLEAA